MTEQISSCMMCGHGFKWDDEEFESIPDHCSDCRDGNPPTIYHD